MENIKFNLTHAKALIDAEKLEDVKTYIKQFFFNHKKRAKFPWPFPVWFKK